ncbi:hypothetical protein AB0L59_27590 [Streptomyces sp. NPDC052109]|uniref:hypothetical protein n=1 Tax=Streptomyces sp. NPDC052109 TaxID=3155527 RepID=UPI003443C106
MPETPRFAAGGGVLALAVALDGLQAHGTVTGVDLAEDRVGTRVIAVDERALVGQSHDLLLFRPVAVKALRPELAADAERWARFRREVVSVALLGHPSVGAVYDAGEDTIDGHLVPYLVMDYVKGNTLLFISLRLVDPLGDDGGVGRRPGLPGSGRVAARIP